MKNSRGVNNNICILDKNVHKFWLSRHDKMQKKKWRNFVFLYCSYDLKFHLSTWTQSLDDTSRRLDAFLTVYLFIYLPKKLTIMRMPDISSIYINWRWWRLTNKHILLFLIYHSLWKYLTNFYIKCWQLFTRFTRALILGYFVRIKFFFINDLLYENRLITTTLCFSSKTTVYNV